MPNSELSAAMMWDGDGYFTAMLQDDETRQLRERPPLGFNLSRDNAQSVRLIYFLMRSSATMAGEITDDALSIYEYWIRMCKVRALEYVASGQLERMGTPLWAELFRSRLVETLGDDYPLAGEIEIVPTLTPRLYARSFPSRNQVEVSAVTRELLRNVNQLLLRHYNDFAKDESFTRLIAKSMGEYPPKPPIDAFDYSLLPLLLRHVLPFHRPIGFGSIPVIFATDGNEVWLAQHITSIQVSFMLAHEFAHVLLHKEAPTGDPSVEAEADMFAYRFLFQFYDEKRWGDIWIAIRWLFRFLAFDRIIGSIVYESSIVDYDQDSFLSRLFVMYNLLTHPISWNDNIIEAVGTVLLMISKADLRRRSRSFVLDFTDTHLERHRVDRSPFFDEH